MELTRLTLVYFSPSGSSLRVGRLAAEEFRLPVVEDDLTENAPPKYLDLMENDLLIAVVPCYNGRVPYHAAVRLTSIAGRGTPAIPIVTFGNVGHGDALRELGDILTGNGFINVAAAAIATENALDRRIGAGRPDEMDRAELKSFAMKARVKLGGLQTVAQGLIPLERDEPYVSDHVLGVTPSRGMECNLCLKCVERCPTGAIPRDDTQHIDGAKCIMCMRCVYECPNKARYLGKRAQLVVGLALGHKAQQRKTNLFYL